MSDFRPMISRADAKRIAQKWYFTGKECPHGHVSHRWVSTGGCSACLNENTDRNRKADPEKENIRRRAYYAKNTEKLRAARRNTHEKHKDRYNAQRRELRLTDGDTVRERERMKQALHPERKQLADKRQYAANPDRSKGNAAKWASENKEARRKIAQAYSKRNPEKKAAQQAKYRYSRRSAAPSWLTKEQSSEIKKIYAECRRCSLETGILHHVDHIMPLRGATSCGLHVPWNLQILPAIKNLQKGNRL